VVAIDCLVSVIQVYIGRDVECDHRISSIEISRKHALIEYSLADDYWNISDLNVSGRPLWGTPSPTTSLSTTTTTSLSHTCHHVLKANTYRQWGSEWWCVVWEGVLAIG
jgi:hypothetical protein